MLWKVTYVYKVYTKQKCIPWVWECSLVVECSASMQEALGLILARACVYTHTLTHTNQNKTSKEFPVLTRVSSPRYVENFQNLRKLQNPKHFCSPAFLIRDTQPIILFNLLYLPRKSQNMVFFKCNKHGAGGAAQWYSVSLACTRPWLHLPCPKQQRQRQQNPQQGSDPWNKDQILKKQERWWLENSSSLSSVFKKRVQRRILSLCSYCDLLKTVLHWTEMT